MTNIIQIKLLEMQETVYGKHSHVIHVLNELRNISKLLTVLKMSIFLIIRIKNSVKWIFWCM